MTVTLTPQPRTVRHTQRLKPQSAIVPQPPSSTSPQSLTVPVLKPGFAMSFYVPVNSFNQMN